MEIIEDFYPEDKIEEIWKKFALGNHEFIHWDDLDEKKKRYFAEVVEVMGDYPLNITKSDIFSEEIRNVLIYSYNAHFNLKIGKKMYVLLPNQLAIPKRETEIKILDDDNYIDLHRNKQDRDEKEFVLFFRYPIVTKGNYKKNLFREIYGIKDLFLMVLDYLSLGEAILLTQQDSVLFRGMKNDSRYWKKRLGSEKNFLNPRKKIIQYNCDIQKIDLFLGRESARVGKYFRPIPEYRGQYLCIDVKYGRVKKVKENFLIVSDYGKRNALELAIFYDQIEVVRYILEIDRSIFAYFDMLNINISKECIKVMMEINGTDSSILIYAVQNAFTFGNFDVLGYLFNTYEIEIIPENRRLLESIREQDKKKYLKLTLVETHRLEFHVVTEDFKGREAILREYKLTDLIPTAAILVDEFPEYQEKLYHLIKLTGGRSSLLLQQTLALLLRRKCYSFAKYFLKDGVPLSLVSEYVKLNRHDSKLSSLLEKYGYRII